MKQTYLITAINPDDNKVISVWLSDINIQLAAENSYLLLREEYNIIGYLDTILSVTLMNDKHSK